MPRIAGLPTSAQAFVLARDLAAPVPILWIVPDVSTRKHAMHALRAFSATSGTARRIQSIDIPTPFVKDRANKLALWQDLHAYLQEPAGVTFITAQQLLTPVPSLKSLTQPALTVGTGQIIPQAHILKSLQEAGYELTTSHDANGSVVRTGESISVQLPKKRIRIIWNEDIVEAIQSTNTNDKDAQPTHCDALPFVPNLSDMNEQTSAPLLQLIATMQRTTIVISEPQHIEAFFDSEYTTAWSRFITQLSDPWLFPAFLDEQETLQARHPLQSDFNTGFRDSVQLRIYSHHTEAAQRLYTQASVEPFPPHSLPFPGFISDRWNHIVLTDYDIPELQKLSLPATARSSAAADLALIQSLKEGDHVVHIDHGVGIFRGIEQQSISGIEREFFLLEYAEGDKLFVPVTAADRLSTYSGSSDPTIQRLHSTKWQQISRKAQEDAEVVAQELLEAAATREAQTGYAFPSRSQALTDMIDAFAYEETPDQLTSWSDIEADMEGRPHPNRKQPMDRLLAGDVGFGKTELAMRAAFKAADAGKQVLVLAPTTILAQQHYDRFTDRLASFDTTIGLLTRFVSSAQQRRTSEQFTKGAVQILIGTHRLLGRDIIPKDLGLIIIDEEQKFGVQHKEQLKRLRANVDVLSLSATPIPRTLHSAIGGLRSLSTIATPPKGRKPVHTTIHAHSDTLVKEAIERELERNGQVFYLHNRVATIQTQAKRLQSQFPNHVVGVAHGQMNEASLQKVMEALDHGKIDILVCTTIVENGLDVPNVNTLIVHDSTRFGLSQLYQLRGRIGRGGQHAYALFLYQREELKGAASERLKALQEAQRLGSGFQIAMRDLDIRGAGNLLGKEQSGHMQSIGISLYARLLQRAMQSFASGRDTDIVRQLHVDLPVNASLPQTYIDDIEDRMTTYQRWSIAATHTATDVQHEIARTTERYGPLPESAQCLQGLLMVKSAAYALPITRIDAQPAGFRSDAKQIHLTFSEPPHPRALHSFISAHPQWHSSGNRNLHITWNALGENDQARLRALYEHIKELERLLSYR